MTNNLNDNSNRTRTKKPRKEKYTARITNAASTRGINISYCKIISLLKQLLPDKTIIINPPLLCY
jgi:hypothetical protein